MKGREEVADYLAAHDVPRETMARLDTYVEMLVAEAAQQNLVSAATLPEIWSRHILDSLQLLPLAKSAGARWLDVGSGAGLPGLVIAAAGRHRVTLAETRRRRVDFLGAAASAMGVDVTLHLGRAQTLSAGKFDVISARAVAALDALCALGHGLSHASTRLILPKGRGARMELAAARRSWQGRFEVVPSITDPDASIIVASKLKPKGKQ